MNAWKRLTIAMTNLSQRLTPEEHKKLKELAEANGISKAGCLRLLIIEAHKYIGARERTI